MKRLEGVLSLLSTITAQNTKMLPIIPRNEMAARIAHTNTFILQGGQLFTRDAKLQISSP